MYTIIESTPKGNRTIIDIVSNLDFEKEICKYVEDKYNNINFIRNFNDANIMDNKYHQENYLVKYENSFCLYKKYTREGICNKSNQTNCIKKICDWTALPLESNLIDKIKDMFQAKQYENIELSKFKLSSMINNPRILIIAKRGSGKSYIARHISKHLEKLNPSKTNNLIVSPQDKFNGFYRYCNLNAKIVYSLEETEDFLTNLDNNNTNYIVYDDILSRYKYIYKNSDKYLNNKLSLIVCNQTPIGMTPELRASFDYIFLLKENSSIDRKKLWNYYANIFPSLESFEKVFDAMTKDYKCMVIDNTKPRDSIQEKVFWFKAKRYD